MAWRAIYPDFKTKNRMASPDPGGFLDEGVVLLGLPNFVVRSHAVNGSDSFQWGAAMIGGVPWACSMIRVITGVECILPAVSSSAPKMPR